MPAHIAQETPGHPKPAKVNQYWYYGGEWVMVPIKPSDQGAWLNNWRAGRIEPVIDMNGKLVKVLSYGEGAEELTVWFWLEDILKLFPDWIIPAPPKFFNNKKFNKMTLRDSSTYKANNQGNQGYRGSRGASGSGNGNYRGRGYTNGNYRGRGYSRGGGRPMDYQGWDEEQSGRGQNYEQRAWEDYQNQQWSNRDQNMPQGGNPGPNHWPDRDQNMSQGGNPGPNQWSNRDQNMPQGDYYTNEYGQSRKRERSPSARRYTDRDSSPRGSQDRGRGDRHFGSGSDGRY